MCVRADNMEEPTSTTGQLRKRKGDTEERQRVISDLRKGSGFAIFCKTVVRVHRSDPVEQEWKVFDYGIPAVTANEDSVHICIADVESGEIVKKFKVTSNSSYEASEDHFHVLSCEETISSEEACFGLSFADVTVAKKLLSAIHQLAPHACRKAENDEVQPSPAKKRRVESKDAGESDEKHDDDWVIIEPGDVPAEVRVETEKPVKQVKPDGGEEEGEDEEEEEEERREGVDAPFKMGTLTRKLKKKKKEEPKKLEISAPTDFQHLSHIGGQSTIGDLQFAISGTASVEEESKAISGTEEESKEAETSVVEKSTQPGTLESGTKRSSSFIAVEPGEAHSTTQSSEANTTPPPQTRIPPLPKIGNLPTPPPLSDQEALIWEISTFDRKKLRHVERNFTDSHREEDPLSMQSMLKSGMDRMMHKLALKFQFSRTASITSSGEEEGFDDFDFHLFEE